MTRKLTNKRLKAIADMRIAVETTGSSAARELAQRPAAPEYAEAAYRLVFEHLHAEIVALESKLEGAETTYVASQMEAREHKTERDQAKADLERRHRRIKRFLTGFFQPHNLAAAGVVGTTPSDAFALARQVSSTVDYLRQLDVVATPPILEVGFDALAMAEELATGADRLESGITSLYAARAAVDGARGAADTASAEAARVGVSIARLLECLGLLAGEEGMARRVRNR